jgi:hypothetical protein
MSTTTQQPGALALHEYKPFPLERTPCFCHLLVCSTAPLEAERPCRLDLTQAGFDHTAQHFAELKPIAPRSSNGSRTAAVRRVCGGGSHPRLQRSPEQCEGGIPSDGAHLQR